MSPVLPGNAGILDAVTIEEGSVWDPIFHQLVLGSTSITGTHVPFAAGTIAYATFRYSLDGEALFHLGPAADAMEGTLTVDVAGGTIAANLPPLETIGLDFPKLGAGVWDMIVYHGGLATRAKRFLQGPVIYSRRSTERPPDPGS